MIRGLVASILGFWPGAPEAPRFFKLEVGADGWLGLLHTRYLMCICTYIYISTNIYYILVYLVKTLLPVMFGSLQVEKAAGIAEKLKIMPKVVEDGGSLKHEIGK